MANIAKTKTCKYCKSQIDSKAKICPYCRKKQKGGLLGTILLIIGIFLFIVGFLGSGSSDSKSSSSASSSSSKPAQAATYLADNPGEMTVGGIGEYQDLHIGLAYVKTQSYLQTAIDYFKEEISSDHQVVYAIFEVYNPTDKTKSFSYSAIEGYADSSKAEGVDTIYKVACDNVKQLDSYPLAPKTRAYIVCDFEVPNSTAEMKFYCGNKNIWTVSSGEFAVDSFNDEQSLFASAEQPAIEHVVPDTVVYNDKYEIIYKGFTTYTDSNVIAGETNYAVFKFHLNNTSDEELDYSNVGYKMTLYRNGLLQEDCTYTMDSNIDGFINVFKVDKVRNGMGADYYVAFPVKYINGEMYLSYNTGWLTDELLFELAETN